MAVSKGKEWEAFFKNFVVEHNKISDNKVDIVRLYDVIGKKTIEQPADFICYRYPHEVYVECKSTHEGSFSYYTQPQYIRLLAKSRIHGVRAGMILWFVKHQEIFWLDVNWLEAFYAKNGVKSVSAKGLNEYVKTGARGVYKVNAEFARVNPKTINVGELFDYIKEGI